MDPVAMPQAGRVGCGVHLQAARDGLLQTFQHRAGQTRPRLTVGGVGKGQTAEMADMASGGVAMQDLLEEQMGGDDGAKIAFAPVIADFGTALLDEAGGNGLGETVLDKLNGLRHIHGSCLVLGCGLNTFILAGGSCFYQSAQLQQR